MHISMWPYQWGCVVVDQQCRGSNGKRKIEGYTRVSDEEAHHHFSQPKLKLYGLFQALCSLKAYLIRVRNLVVKGISKGCWWTLTSCYLPASITGSPPSYYSTSLSFMSPALNMAPTGFPDNQSRLLIKMKDPQKTQNLMIGLTRCMGLCIFSTCSNWWFYVWNGPWLMLPKLSTTTTSPITLLARPCSHTTYSHNPIDSSESMTICTVFVTDLSPWNVFWESPMPHTPHFCTIPSASSKRMVTFGGGICKAIIK